MRRALGPEIAPDGRRAIHVETPRPRWRRSGSGSEFDLFFLETPIWVGQSRRIARLRDAARWEVASGEWLATHWEFEDLIERGKIEWRSRTSAGSAASSRRRRSATRRRARPHHRAALLEDRAVLVTATAHSAFNTPHCAFIEYLPPHLCVETLAARTGAGRFRVRRWAASFRRGAGPRDRDQPGGAATLQGRMRLRLTPEKSR